MSKTAEQLADEYYDDAWAEEHIAPVVDKLDKDLVMGMYRLMQINDAFSADVAGVIVNLCELCSYEDKSACESKPYCIDGIKNSNYCNDDK